MTDRALKINRKALLEALAPLKPAVPSRTSIEALTHIWFDGEYAYAHDGGMGIRVKFSTPFKFGVVGGLLLGLASQASADSLTFEATASALTFKAGRSNVKLSTLPLDRRVWPYPEEPAGKPTASLKASAAFLAALKRVFLVRASNPQRMEHYAVSIFPFEKDDIELYATDSRTMALAPVKEPLTGKVKALAVPRSLAEQLVSQCEDEPLIRMYGDYFQCDANARVTLYSNVFDTSEIMDLPGVADKFCDAPTFTIPEGFRAALEKVLLMAGSEEPVIQLKSNGKKLELLGKFKFGEISEEFELDRAAPKRSIRAMASLLLTAKDAQKMALLEDELGIVLRGAEGFAFMMAGYTGAQQRED